ncbi:MULTISPECIES: hypothetical protein [Achromobacter]|jgi:hypothetical protein|uniref:hypothetical protein n=1 Tax=Achromobacter TaxID=222 RepID=UPI001040F990|nr:MULTISPECIES: hypothetical protein [Achromobacter]
MHAAVISYALPDVGRVIQRLDQASTMLGQLNPELRQAVLYAGFLTDVQAGRLDVRETPVAKMVHLVDQFCNLVESQFAEPSYPSYQ